MKTNSSVASRVAVPTAIGRLLSDKIAQVNRQRDRLSTMEKELNDAIREIQLVIVGDVAISDVAMYDPALCEFVIQPRGEL